MTERRARACGMLSLGARGEFLRVWGDTARVCALLLGRCEGKRDVYNQVLEVLLMSHTNEPASTI